MILPVPVFLKRFFAPVWVFNLGIFFSISAKAGCHRLQFGPSDRDSPAPKGLNQYTAGWGYVGYQLTSPQVDKKKRPPIPRGRFSFCYSKLLTGFKVNSLQVCKLVNSSTRKLLLRRIFRRKRRAAGLLAGLEIHQLAAGAIWIVHIQLPFAVYGQLGGRVVPSVQPIGSP